MSDDVLDAPFNVVRRGYDRGQVDEAVRTLRGRLDEAVAERQAAAGELRSITRKLEASESAARAARATTAESSAELAKLRDQVAELSTLPSTVDGMSNRLQEMVRITQDEVNEMRSRATASAGRVLKLAEAEAEELRERSSRERQQFEAERRAAQESLSKQLAESQTRLEQLRNDSSGWRSQVEDELAQRKDEAEKALNAEIDRRRSTMLADLKRSEAEHRENAASIREAADEQARSKLAEATSEANRIQTAAQDSVATAQREVEGLHALGHQVAEQLTSVRALLDWTLPQLGVALVAQSRTGDAGQAKPDAAGSARAEAERQPEVTSQDVRKDHPAGSRGAPAGTAEPGDPSTANSTRAPSPVPVRPAPAAGAPAGQTGTPSHPGSEARPGSKTSPRTS